MSSERIEEEWLNQIDTIQKALVTETKTWRKVYLYQRFFEYFSRLRLRFNTYIIPHINCRNPKRIRAGHSQIGSRINMEDKPDYINILSAIGNWRDEPTNDIFVCEVQQSIFKWVSFMANQTLAYMENYRQLRRQLIREFLSNPEQFKEKTHIYELVMFSNVLWCDRDDETSVSKMEYEKGQPFSKGHDDITFMLKEVREFCARCKFTRPQTPMDVTKLSICEQWNELITYFLSLLEIGHRGDVFTYDTLDWAGKYSYKEIMTILEFPEFWLKKRFGTENPIEVQFDYHAWVLQDNSTLTSLPNLKSIKDPLFQQANQLLSAISVAMWIISRLSRFIHNYS